MIQQHRTFSYVYKCICGEDIPYWDLPLPFINIGLKDFKKGVIGFNDTPLIC